MGGAFRIIGGTDEGLYFRHGDHLGSTSVLSDEDGLKVTDSEVVYAPFGEIREGDLSDLTDFGFTGQQLDRSTGGLMYYGARYYLPELRRFISADTIVPDEGTPQALNRYAYVLNSPINYVDPTGHDPHFCDSSPDPGACYERAWYDKKNAFGGGDGPGGDEDNEQIYLSIGAIGPDDESESKRCTQTYQVPGIGKQCEDKVSHDPDQEYFMTGIRIDATYVYDVNVDIFEIPGDREGWHVYAAPTGVEPLSGGELTVGFVVGFNFDEASDRAGWDKSTNISTPLIFVPGGLEVEVSHHATLHEDPSEMPILVYVGYGGVEKPAIDSVAISYTPPYDLADPGERAAFFAEDGRELFWEQPFNDPFVQPFLDKWQD